MMKHVKILAGFAHGLDEQIRCSLGIVNSEIVRFAVAEACRCNMIKCVKILSRSAYRDEERVWSLNLILIQEFLSILSSP